MSQNYIITNGELYHWGIKGMKWGVRRYQNKDGSLTPAGKKRYSDEVSYMKKKHSKDRYESEAASYERELKWMNDLGYKKYAKDTYLTELSDNEQRKIFAEQQAEVRNMIESAKHFANNTHLLSKRLDSIDPSSMPYKKAVKLVRQYENDWLNETIDSDPTLRGR